MFRRSRSKTYMHTLIHITPRACFWGLFAFTFFEDIFPLYGHICLEVLPSFLSSDLNVFLQLRYAKLANELPLHTHVLRLRNSRNNYKDFDLFGKNGHLIKPKKCEGVWYVTSGVCFLVSCEVCRLPVLMLDCFDLYHFPSTEGKPL